MAVGVGRDLVNQSPRTSVGWMNAFARSRSCDKLAHRVRLPLAPFVGLRPGWVDRLG
jgi:hypothetical protein